MAPLTPAERQRRYRNKRRAQFKAAIATVEYYEVREALSRQAPASAPAAASVASTAQQREDDSLRTRLQAAQRQLSEQARKHATERAAERAQLEALEQRMKALRQALRAVLGRLSLVQRQMTRAHLQETGFIEWLDAD